MIVTVEEAAKELHMTPATVRYLMATGALNIGDTWMKPGARRRVFRIYREMLDAEKAKRGIH